MIRGLLLLAALVATPAAAQDGSHVHTTPETVEVRLKALEDKVAALEGKHATKLDLACDDAILPGTSGPAGGPLRSGQPILFPGCVATPPEVTP